MLLVTVSCTVLSSFVCADDIYISVMIAEWPPFGKELFARLTYEPRCEKTGLRGFRPGPT